jgi:hypothetical protein
VQHLLGRLAGLVRVESQISDRPRPPWKNDSVPGSHKREGRGTAPATRSDRQGSYTSRGTPSDRLR